MSRASALTLGAEEHRRKMEIEYRPARVEDYEAIRQFLSDMGWQQRVSDPIKFKKIMDGADRTIVAFEGAQLIGFARALCDEVSNGYLSMLAVSPEKRMQGIGREIIKRLMGEEEEITWVLRAGRGSGGFWEKIGFKRSEIAMEKTRRR
jgi:N-acetylglutamate synthase-like GNAT family acetyltransferase